ncbi:MAG: Hsp20/alpha crystallin family protein [Acidobacteriota bacterium]
MLTRTRRSHPSRSLTYGTNDPFFRFVDRFFNELGQRELSSDAGDEVAAGWLPALDILETEAGFVAHVDLPGLTKDDIDLSLEDGMLTLSGERKFTHDQADVKGFRRVERAFGRFSRSFTLPQGIDVEGVTASFANGVLELTLPKSEVAKSRKIAIA